MKALYRTNLDSRNLDPSRLTMLPWNLERKKLQPWYWKKWMKTKAIKGVNTLVLLWKLASQFKVHVISQILWKVLIHKVLIFKEKEYVHCVISHYKLNVTNSMYNFYYFEENKFAENMKKKTHFQFFQRGKKHLFKNEKYFMTLLINYKDSESVNS